MLIRGDFESQRDKGAVGIATTVDTAIGFTRFLAFHVGSIQRAGQEIDYGIEQLSRPDAFEGGPTESGL